MADYRQSCRNPACSYTGFSGHSPGCPVPEENRQYERKLREKRAAEEKAWKVFFDSMTEEEFFAYRKRCEDEISRVHRFKVRLDKMNEYILWNNRNLLRKYQQWRTK